MSSPSTEGPRVVIEWWVRPSLIEYLRRTPDFAVRVAGEAAFTGRSVRLPAVASPGGRIEATGSAELSGHGGALRLPLHGVVLAEDALWIDDPMGEVPSRRLVLLTWGEGGRAETRLAPESDVLFLYNYLPEAPFGALRVEAVAGD